LQARRLALNKIHRRLLLDLKGKFHKLVATALHPVNYCYVSEHPTKSPAHLRRLWVLTKFIFRTSSKNKTERTYPKKSPPSTPKDIHANPWNPKARKCSKLNKMLLSLGSMSLPSIFRYLQGLPPEAERGANDSSPPWSDEKWSTWNLPFLDLPGAQA